MTTTAKTSNGYTVNVFDHAWEVVDENGKQFIYRYGFKNANGAKKSAQSILSRYGKKMYGEVIW